MEAGGSRQGQSGRRPASERGIMGNAVLILKSLNWRWVISQQKTTLSHDSSETCQDTTKTNNLFGRFSRKRNQISQKVSPAGTLLHYSSNLQQAAGGARKPQTQQPG